VRFGGVVVEPTANICSTALSLPVSETLRKLDNLQQSHESSHRDVADALRTLLQVGVQINGLSQKFDNFVNGAESESRARAAKEEAAAACQSDKLRMAWPRTNKCPGCRPRSLPDPRQDSHVRIRRSTSDLATHSDGGGQPLDLRCSQICHVA